MNTNSPLHSPEVPPLKRGAVRYQGAATQIRPPRVPKGMLAGPFTPQKQIPMLSPGVGPAWISKPVGLERSGKPVDPGPPAAVHIEAWQSTIEVADGLQYTAWVPAQAS